MKQTLKIEQIQTILDMISVIENMLSNIEGLLNDIDVKPGTAIQEQDKEFGPDGEWLPF